VANHIRVLAESDQKSPLAELRTVLGPEFEIVAEQGDEKDWSQIVLQHRNGQEIALIERDPVAEGELGEVELETLIEEMRDALPSRAVEWLKHYFSHVKVVYALQPMSGAELKNGWLAINRVQAYFWKKVGGILQADNEGFTNREGYQILWQFHGPQTGQLESAVMDDAGKWIGFVMDMGDPEQVAAFQRGEVPAAAVRHS